jgi:nickel/cobalt transporter (NicO) family protein
MNLSSILHRFVLSLIIFAGLFGFADVASAHPLGNFTINHFSQLSIAPHQVTIQSVVDMAEIPAFQALQVADTNRDKVTSDAELKAYLEQIVPRYAKNLVLEVDHRSIPLRLKAKMVSLPPGAGGLSTLRMEWEMTGEISGLNLSEVHQLRFEDENDRTRIGWREMVVNSESVNVFDSSAYRNSLTNALRNYPQDLLTTPLQESIVNLSFTQDEIPANSTLLSARQTDSSHPLTDLKALFTPSYQRSPLPNVDWNSTGGIWVAIVGAFIWGAMHSLSPGHGKTVVGAYLVGTRATPGHALFLAFTTTITHTIGVFALGLITLFAAEYILPEQLYPWLGLGSGVMVVTIGFNLFSQRLGLFQKTTPLLNHGHSHEHSHEHSHGHSHDHSHSHSQDYSHSHSQDYSHSHSHHDHSPSDSPVTWKSLLALGISGGLMPCPAALVLLLGSIALSKVAFGLILVLAFSLGLAGVLTGLGLLLVYAKHLFQDVPVSLKFVHRLPAIGALCMAIVGLGISTKALLEIGGFQ